MNKGRMNILILIIAIPGIVLASMAIANAFQKPSENIEAMEPIDFANLPPGITIVQEMSMAAYSREELIDRSEAIFVGKVLAISPTFWNQDSGEYWYEDGVGLQLHTIELEVLQPIVNTIGIEKLVKIYVLGPSPVDGGMALENDTTVQQGGAEYELTVGDQVIFFASRRDIAWRGGGTQQLLMSYPPLDLFIQLPDGMYNDPWDQDQEVTKAISFEALLGEIAARRETLVQP
ncbi:MAG: hypothetical protein Fur0022_48600 [Anaerolineales bacterium]